MKIARRLTVVLGLVAAAVGGFLLVRAQRGFSAGEKLIDRQAWEQARTQLGRYLWIHPNDPQARLLMAEALVKDERLPVRPSAAEAIAHLSRIPDSSQLGATARIHEARVAFLLLDQPVRAEELLRRALRQDPDSREAHLALWKIFDMTGRADWCEPLFWRAYELSPEDERPVLLRDWYLSQFIPGARNSHLDRQLGFVEPSDKSTALGELRRLIGFRQAEIEAPVTHAAVAWWFLRYDDPEQAIEVFREAKAARDPFAEPYYVAVLAEACLEQGWFERAEEYFGRWPEPREGYHFWRIQGILQEELHGDGEAAVGAYRRALKVWPGEMDWKTRFRMAGCLTRLGRHKAAAELRAEAMKIQDLMKPEFHQHLRDALDHLGERDQILKLARFYRDLGRAREAECWQREVARLQANSAETGSRPESPTMARP